MVRRVHCIVKGEVQGVGFRAFTQRHAGRLGLTGWVRNLFDGNVEIEVEGPEQLVREFMENMRAGPRMAAVEEVEILETEQSEERRHNDFTVRFDN